jgi:NAD(P)-dependent dehydrogenase (short-subunit alcohol dehydrogenase family)
VVSEPSGRLAGRTAVVTGAASGLGRAIALRFAREGANVVVSDLQPGPIGARSEETPTVDVITAEGGSAVFVHADVRLTADVEALIAEATGITGRLDIVINNAGLFGLSPLLETSDEKWDDDISLNLRSQFLMCRTAIAQMVGQDPIDEVRGRIVNLSSQLGMTAAPGATTYGVAKAGVAQLTRQLAIDFARDGIIVNAIAPGRIITGTQAAERDYLATGSIDEATAFSLSRTPFPRLGRPEDVAGAALFLASDDCTFISGHNLMVDGGWVAY